MGLRREFQHAALALIALSVVALYGAAALFPAARPQHTTARWIPLPDGAPAAILPLAVLQPATPPAADTSRTAARKTIGDADKRETRRAGFSVATLRDKFDAADFDLGAVRHGDQAVPRLFVNVLPQDLGALGEAGKLKQTFFKMVLPLTLKVNEEILGERHRLLLLQKKIAAGRPPTDAERDWLAAMADRYGTAPGDVPELLRRVDVISPALAIAQSAEESGWGRSRFAVRGNALFGQKTWGKGPGMVPLRRDEGLRHEVRVFPSLLDSVRSYARNLNGHPAYGEFRARRAEMRARDGALDPYALIETLTAYSERREGYVRTIEKILRRDNLEQLEDTRLENQPLETAQRLTRVEQR